MHPDAPTGETAAQISLRFVDELNHRVINEFAEAISGLSHDAARAATIDSRLCLEQAVERLHRHADLHRALLRPIASGDMDLTAYLSRICKAFSSAFAARQNALIVLNAEDVRITADRCWRIGLIVAELVRNALRHGLSGNDGLILVNVRADVDAIVCHVWDTGCSPQPPQPGRGQKLVETIASELGGTVDWAFTPEGGVVRLELQRQ